MYLGRIVEDGPADRILADPQHPYTRDLLAAAPDPDTHTLAPPPDDPRLQAIADAEPADPHHPPSGCRYHPRCPVGPLIHPDRTNCVSSQPTADHPNHATCHYTPEMSPALG